MLDDHLLLQKLADAGIPVKSLGPVPGEQRGIRFEDSATREQKDEAEQIRKEFYSEAGKLERQKERAKEHFLNLATPKILMQLAMQNAKFAAKMEAIDAATATEELKEVINGR